MVNWINIISFTYPHEAHLVKSLLEDYEIEVILKDELTVQVNSLYSNALGGVKILVAPDKVDEALTILENAGYINKESTAEKVKIETFSSAYKSQCPYCNSTNVTPRSTPGYIIALSIITLGFPLPFFRKVYYCYDCLKEWNINKKLK